MSGGNFEAGEQAGIGRISLRYVSRIRRRWRGRGLINSSTFGRMRVDDHVDAGGGRDACRRAWLSFAIGRDAVEEERIEDDVDISRQAPDRSRRTRAHSRRRDWAAPACRRAAPAICRAFSRPNDAFERARVTPGSMPRSVSLAPSSTMTASVPSGTDQSSRASPPAAVSPDTPALAMVTAWPLASSAASSLAGKASALAGRPSPAVSESPSATILSGRSAGRLPRHAQTCR